MVARADRSPKRVKKKQPLYKQALYAGQQSSKTMRDEEISGSKIEPMSLASTARKEKHFRPHGRRPVSALCDFFEPSRKDCTSRLP
jgi:hypothetical protein